ncbi:Erf-like ssDNA annealing protein [Clostridium phage phiCP13O]|uniref:Erf-like ssDNA annealing protein n=1 Tax=Clostridium phage phiCP13O TaxID=1042122 RepID=UPI000214C73D|nr:Erf-like ssDNA annealing protein [Clostridium phage phiCP13O]AEI74471.1 ERF superfamily protein [Clostridium phage phiCP13O]
MNRSETIVKLAVALAKFNAEVTSISKDAKNPFFKSDYVTLDKLILATRDILQKNGLSVLQMPLSKETGEIGIQTIYYMRVGNI